MHRREGLASGLNREVDVRAGVSGAEESRFELRGWKPYPLIEHRPMKAAKSFRVRCGRTGEVA